MARSTRARSCGSRSISFRRGLSAARNSPISIGVCAVWCACDRDRRSYSARVDASPRGESILASARSARRGTYPSQTSAVIRSAKTPVAKAGFATGTLPSWVGSMTIDPTVPRDAISAATMIHSIVEFRSKNQNRRYVAYATWMLHNTANDVGVRRPERDSNCDPDRGKGRDANHACRRKRFEGLIVGAVEDVGIERVDIRIKVRAPDQVVILRAPADDGTILEAGDGCAPLHRSRLVASGGIGARETVEHHRRVSRECSVRKFSDDERVPHHHQTKSDGNRRHQNAYAFARGQRCVDSCSECDCDDQADE